MKQGITGYIVGIINNHSRIVENMKKCERQVAVIAYEENYINELNDLLDYVTDIPEESQEPITVVLNTTEVETLKSRIRELEETCIANNEVIDTQFKKIKELKDSNYLWQNACIKLREENEKVKECELPYIDFQKIYDGAEGTGSDK